MIRARVLFAGERETPERVLYFGGVPNRDDEVSLDDRPGTWRVLVVDHLPAVEYPTVDQVMIEVLIG